MPRSAVQVFVRSRASSAINAQLQFLPDRKTVVVSTVKDTKTQPATGTAGSQYQFKFDGVLHEASQEDVFETCAVDVIKSALEGFNGTIMCYGQTGAGKTYTMSGGKQNFKQRGLIPRALTHLFSLIKQRSSQDTRVTISYLEIYNEQLYDLLDMTTQPHEIQIQDLSAAKAARYLSPSQSQGSGPAGATTVKVTGLKSATVESEAEAMKLLFEGETNRVIGEHQLNRESSRSHSIFQVTLETRQKDDPSGVVVASRLCLVDLAGSERVSKTRSEGVILREAGHINKSLSILEQVIIALSERGRDHVPYRSCKLTHVLKDSLGGNCATVLIANVWEEADQLDETLSTCRFAQRMMRVVCEVTPNVIEDSSAKVRQLQRQINELQQELAMHDAMSGRQGVTYGPYSAAQRAMLQAQLDLFLDGEDPESVAPLELSSLRHMREILLALRGRVKDKLELADRRMEEARALAMARPALPALPPTVQRSDVLPQRSDAPPQGEDHPAEPLSPTSALEARLGAPDSVGPPGPDGEPVPGLQIASSTTTTLDSGPSAGGQQAIHPVASTSTSSASAGAGHHTSLQHPPDKLQAFEDFKAGPGAVKSGLLDTNRSRLKAIKKRAKELGLSINSLKRELDELKSRADALKSARHVRGAESAQVLEPEELDTLNNIKECKRQYKDQFGELQMLKSEVDYTQQLCDTCQKEIVADFQQWYSDMYGVTLTTGSHHPGQAATASAEDPSGYELASDQGPASPSAASTTSTATHNTRPTPPPRAPQPMAGSLQSGPGRPAAVRGPRGGPAGGAQRKGGGVAGTSGGGGKLPVVATPQPEPGELEDPDAAAFYSAQQAMMARTQGLHRPGSFKKKTGPDTTFSNTNRADITAKTTADAFLKSEAVTRSPRT